MNPVYKMWTVDSLESIRPLASQRTAAHDFIFLSNTMMFFSKWLVFSPSSGPGHVPIALNPTPAAWHMVPHRLVLLSASN